MTINSRTLWTSLVTVLVMAIAIVALSAQVPPGRGGSRQPGVGPAHGRGPMGMLRGVDLTDAQREQIRAIVTEQRTGEDSMRKLGELRRELHTAIFADTPDPARIEQLKGAIVEAEAAALAARIEHQLKIAQVLTPDQRAKVREMPGPGPRGRGARP